MTGLVTRSRGARAALLLLAGLLLGPATAQDDAGPFRVGLVVPTQTGSLSIEASLYDLVGEAARMGALLAESDLAGRDDREGLEPLDLLLASSPSAEAARRAAERLLLADGVDALVGGLGDGQAEVLAEVAARHGVPFLNIGSSLPSLRDACSPMVFHVEASAAMYLDALVGWHSRGEPRRWFVVHVDDEEGRALQEQAQAAVERRGEGGEVVGTATVVTEQASYVGVLDEVRRSGANAILLLVGPRDQIGFLAQQESVGPPVVVAPYPHAVTQTRDYLSAARFRSGAAGAGDRVLAWDTTLQEGDAADLNERYLSRWGHPMDPSAWAAYQALAALDQAHVATGSVGGEALAAYLESAEAALRSAKGEGVAFRPGDHQLRQPLYVVTIDPEAAWSQNLSDQVGVADLVATLPGDAGMDALGKPEASCAP